MNPTEHDRAHAARILRDWILAIDAPYELRRPDASGNVDLLTVPDFVAVAYGSSGSGVSVRRVLGMVAQSLGIVPYDENALRDKVRSDTARRWGDGPCPDTLSEIDVLKQIAGIR